MFNRPVHQLKVDKRLLTDQLKSASSNVCKDHKARIDLKDMMTARFKHDEERLKLSHQSEIAEKVLEVTRNSVELEAKDEQIKALKGEITTLQNKARQYDNIAATGIKSMMGLRAFNERATTR